LGNPRYSRPGGRRYRYIPELTTLKTSMANHTPSPMPEYRGRLAPSPTGYLHLGHARTFWTAYKRARAANGVLVMRMEDLDPDRSRAEYAEAALEDLHWLEIEWQEGPGASASNHPFAPYEQSQRRAFYLNAWRKLLRGGFLFPCRCSRKDLETALAAPHESSAPDALGAQCNVLSHLCDKNVARMGHPSGAELPPLDDEPIYPGTCRSAAFPMESACKMEEPGGVNWRFRVPDGEAIEFVDENLGPQRFVAGVDFGDFVVWRRDGVPSYQLACVVDDAAMRITEVVRGEDLLKSTARQMLLYRALGLEAPRWFHCRLVLDAQGRRLAKRCDALSLRTLRQRGVTPGEILSGTTASADQFSLL
jgi:glutamyl/glutaminyl-tRNA synthetase